MTREAFETGEQDGVFVLKVLRDLDFGVADSVQKALTDVVNAGRRAVVCDLQGVKVIDSSGMKALACGQITARKAGAGFAVVCTEKNLCRLFDVTGLAEFIPIRATVADAAHVVKGTAAA
ncbi:MAG: STAS domain-containing protein [Candidatus Xenobia bacterium]